MNAAIHTFVLVLASIFPVVNPPGSALVFLGLTSRATPELRAVLARRIAVNSLILLACSFLLGALILQFYGISIPILRVAGGFVVAVSGWKLLNEGSQKEMEASAGGVDRTNLLDQAFYPLTLPLTTGPGSIAVVISIGLSDATISSPAERIIFVLASLSAIAVLAVTILFCFAYADRIQRLLGHGGTDIAVRLSAFILFCLGLQILWSGGNELLRSVLYEGAAPSLPTPR
ncbi:MarC family protein [Aminobacter sp. AP02]|uniref:MarC family protein n=1 Tax=Aminobacter sp. AP02 TaxID=2135737 RepID=UPI000D6B5B01|nr:MarC family protein [Aminobacter sp. AP02]PWK65949.1 multiple antibiotic resistance protein [Aminobacter sp. AP02]